MGAVLVALAGCAKPVPRPPPVLPEEPEPTQTVVDRFNANAERMPEGVLLYSPRVEVQAGFFDEEGQEHVFDGEGKLLFVKPLRFYLPLKHDLAGNMVEIGSDEQRYWLWFKKRQTIWWGYHKYIDRPHIRQMPIRPDQVMAALGLTPLPSGSGWLRGPLRRVVRYPLPLNLLSYWRVDENTARYDREYGLSRVAPFLAERIVFFDELGREGCEATLADLNRVEVQDDVISGPGPIMPHRIWLRWPKSDAYFRMTIRKPTLKPLTGRLGDKWYAIEPPPGWRVVQIDEEYDRPMPGTFPGVQTFPSSPSPTPASSGPTSARSRPTSRSSGTAGPSVTTSAP